MHILITIRALSQHAVNNDTSRQQKGSEFLPHTESKPLNRLPKMDIHDIVRETTPVRNFAVEADGQNYMFFPIYLKFT